MCQNDDVPPNGELDVLLKSFGYKAGRYVLANGLAYLVRFDGEAMIVEEEKPDVRT